MNLEAPAAKQLHADELLGDMEPGAINQYVDRTLRTVLRNDAMLPNLGNSIRDKFYVTALKHGIKIVGKKNALATNLITRRQRGLQCGIGDTAFKVTARDPFYVFANDAVAKKIEHAPFEREEKKFANEPGEHRDAAKALAPFLRDAKVEARNDPGRRALKNIKLADARRDVRNELNGARAGADDPDRFTTQVHVGAPRCGMKRRPGETLDARDFRVVRNMERAHAGNQDTRADGHRFCESAVVAGDLTRGDLPAATFVPLSFAKARLEANVRREPVTLHAGFQVLPDFLLPREHAGPAGIAREGKRIKMRGHVASTARVSVFVPGTA